MNIELGKVYFFKLISKFDKLDAIYKVLDILAYSRILEEEHDLVESLYSHIGEDKPELNLEIAGYVEHPFYLLEDQATRIVFCVPGPIVLSADNNVGEYHATMLAIDLGLLRDPAYAHPLAAIVEAAIESNFGGALTVDENGDPLDPAVILTAKSSIQVYSKKWLKSDDYSRIVADRKAAIAIARTGGTPVSIVKRNRELSKQLDEANVRILLLEQALTQ